MITPPFAYVDPNAGGLLSQILTPIVLIIATGATFLRKQIGSAVTRLMARFRH